MTRQERERQVDRLARAHQSACSEGNRDLARACMVLMCIHLRVLEREDAEDEARKREASTSTARDPR